MLDDEECYRKGAGVPGVGSEGGCSLNRMVRVDLRRVFEKRSQEGEGTSSTLQVPENTHNGLKEHKDKASPRGWKNGRERGMAWPRRKQEMRPGNHNGVEAGRWCRTLQATVKTMVSSLRGVRRLWAEEWPCPTCVIMEQPGLRVESQLKGARKEAGEDQLEVCHKNERCW